MLLLSTQRTKYYDEIWRKRVLICVLMIVGRVRSSNSECCGLVRCGTLCCSVLQCVAVCCSVLQCAAVCCSVLQCAAVCCSVLQCAAVCPVERARSSRSE